VQRQLLPLVVELQVGEGNVADYSVDSVFRQLGVAETLDADIGIRVNRPGDPPGYAVQLDADESHPFPRLAHKIADAATWFHYKGVCGNSKAGNRFMDG
jgi:hypothetical protein